MRPLDVGVFGIAGYDLSRVLVVDGLAGPDPADLDVLDAQPQLLLGRTTSVAPPELTSPGVEAASPGRFTTDPDRAAGRCRHARVPPRCRQRAAARPVPARGPRR